MAVTWQWTLPEGPGAIAEARRRIGDLVRDRGGAEDAVLIASELCTNALLHGLPPIVLRAAIDEACVRIEVENRRDGEQAEIGDDHRMPDGHAIGGRGLAMVQALADDWGSKDADGATCVWAELRTAR